MAYGNIFSKRKQL